jgi:MFS transporter
VSDFIPFVGGALLQYLGFRSIFHFLVGLSAVVIVLLALFLPETQRKIVGHGTTRLYGICRSGGGNLNDAEVSKELRYRPSKLSFATLFKSFRLLAEKHAVLPVFGGTIYAIWSMITSSTASLFKEEYDLNEVLIGLAFLPNRLGCILGSLITGKLMDRDYKREAETYLEKHNFPADAGLKQQDFADFPIQEAKLKSVYIPGSGICDSYRRIWLYGGMDHHCPAMSASATAINNLVRCTLGGIGVGFV